MPLSKSNINCPAYHYCIMCKHNKSSAVTEMGDRLATIDMGRKVGGMLCPFPWGEVVPHLTQCGLHRGLPPYHVASLSIQPFSHNRHGLKIGGASFFLGGGSWAPSKWPGVRPTSLPSAILIHPAIWPQSTWVKNWVGVCAPLFGRSWSPSNTMWPGLRPTSVPSFILIHPTIWSQYTNVTYGQDR